MSCEPRNSLNVTGRSDLGKSPQAQLAPADSTRRCAITRQIRKMRDFLVKLSSGFINAPSFVNDPHMDVLSGGVHGEPFVRSVSVEIAGRSTLPFPPHVRCHEAPDRDIASVVDSEVGVRRVRDERPSVRRGVREDARARTIATTRCSCGRLFGRNRFSSSSRLASVIAVPHSAAAAPRGFPFRSNFFAWCMTHRPRGVCHDA